MFGLNYFQILALLIVAIALATTVRAALKRRAGGVGVAFWGVVWLLAAVAIIWPDITKYAAKTLGIGRGANLVFYIAILAMIVGFWMVYIRLRALRREITLLVRRIAIDEAERANHVNSSEPNAKDAT